MEIVLSIYSNIFDGKIPFLKKALIEIDFSGTAIDPNMQIDILIDREVLLSQGLLTNITNFKYGVPDHAEQTEHELCIKVSGTPTGAMLHIHNIRIEGLNMRRVLEESGVCELDGRSAVPSAYIGQSGYQSLKFSTPIYPWLLANEGQEKYYDPH